MSTTSQRFHQRLSFLIAISLFMVTSFGCASKIPAKTQDPTETVFTVDGKVALASLIALSDGHLQKMVDELSFFAKSADARSGKWSKIRGSLAGIAKNNISAVTWFALPRGNYWTVDGGPAKGNLADRPYWSKVMKGQTVVGDLVVSKSTGQNTAILAVPVLGQDKSVVGVLGASIYLDKLSLKLKQEMVLSDNYIFYAIDSTIKGALNSNTNLIFTYPNEFGAEMSKVFDEMVSRQGGVASYHFGGGKRIVLYRKSSAVGWWYAFGVFLKDQ